MNKISKLKFIIFAVIFLFFARPAQAAVFSFESQNSRVRPGGEFPVNLLLDTEGAEINAVEGKILFPLNVLEVKQISDGNSIVNFWAQKPAQVGGKGEIIFSGIIPGGYNGYLGKGQMLSVVFKAKKLGGGQISLSEAKALLNDGFGTSAVVSTTDFEFAISESAPSAVLTAPPDKERPEPFVVNISKDENVFNGKWFAVFATQDKQSGVNHYEISESKQNVGDDYEKLKWQSAESPQVLADQNLGSFIYVKAVDNQNNEYVLIFYPRNPRHWYKNSYFWSIIVILFIVLLYRRKVCGRKKTTQHD